MKREIKFRAFVKTQNRMIEWDGVDGVRTYFREMVIDEDTVLMQFTGLKDKNGLQEVYEGDIIDEYGNIKGNIYEMDKGETGTVIQGFGTKTWCETYSRAILLGLKDSE